MKTCSCWRCGQQATTARSASTTSPSWNCRWSTSAAPAAALSQCPALLWPSSPWTKSHLHVNKDYKRCSEYLHSPSVIPTQTFPFSLKNNGIRLSQIMSISDWKLGTFKHSIIIEQMSQINFWSANDLVYIFFKSILVNIVLWKLQCNIIDICGVMAKSIPDIF